MVQIENGPARGAQLTLKRAPLYLRVVIDVTGGVDALDQLTDEPRPGERIYAYRRLESFGPVHICFAGKDRRRSGWYQHASYEVVGTQPGQDVLADTAAWQAWVVETAAARTAVPA